jgi:hypothetical protein
MTELWAVSLCSLAGGCKVSEEPPASTFTVIMLYSLAGAKPMGLVTICTGCALVALLLEQQLNLI